MRFFLVGYMASGKSTVAKRLARQLNLDFFDLDTYIEATYQKSIDSIFKKEGEAAFRIIEHNCLQILLKQDNYVLALGGGTPCFYNNMDIINAQGKSIYIKMSIQSLADRLIHAKKKRPLIQQHNKQELTTYIAAHLYEREKFYLQAHYVIKGENLNILTLQNLIG